MTPLAQLTASLSDRYAVEREIGRGGMATVYLARDLKHERRVALKLLNPELGALLGPERFLAEIKVTANLQHPNLLPLFDSGEAGGMLFYVMPYVEGESLRAKLVRELQLPVDEALHIAIAVASALDYAHQHGVIHRDLKPENILLQSGQPVVADFGIALAVSNAGGARITQTGLSLGTPQYMSPEQATGDRVLDARSDIYSLGAVLYEMLAGEPPHSGPTSQSIIAKVLTEKPRSLRLHRDTVPAYVESAVERSLAKLPADRFHTAREFAEALSGRSAGQPTSSAATSYGTPAAPAAAKRAGIRPVLPWAIAAVALGVAAVALTRKPELAPTRTIRYQVPLPAGFSLPPTGDGDPVAVSLGGRYVAYSASEENGARRLYLRGADELVGRVVPGSEFPRQPFFSPDGKWIAFWSGGQIKKASVNGGTAVVLADLPVVSRVTWSPSGKLVMTLDGRLAATSEAGGTPQPFSAPDSAHGETAQEMPLALPDGNTVLYTSITMGGPAAAHIGVASLKDGSTTILNIQGAYPLGMLDEYLVYVTAGGVVMAVPFDLGSRKTSGVPVPLVDQVANSTGNASMHASLSADGALVYVSGMRRRELTRLEVGGSARPIIAEAGVFSTPRLSPDGKRLALTLGSGARSDVYVYDLPAGPLVRVTTEGTGNDRPEWMPDGKSLVFRSNRSGLNALWVQPLDGAGSARPLFGQTTAKIDEGVVSNDGHYLIYQADRTGRGELWARALVGDTTPRRVGTGSFGEVGGRFSPDGKWVVYTSSESGTAEVYVRPFPSLAARYQVSLAGGTTPLWSPDAKRIYYVAGRDLVAATIGSTSPFTIASRETVNTRGITFNNIHADYDVMKDGRTVIAFRTSGDDAQIVAVYNWRAEVLARMRDAAR
jgi:eukaryotic-like serine/threonine-protein kinase